MKLLRQQTSRIAGAQRCGKQSLFLLLLIALALAQPARAQALLDPALVPGLDADGRTLYAQWLLTNTERAVAVGSNGKIGWYGGGPSLPTARERALALCAEHGGTACQIYAENLDIVWPGRQAASPKPPGPFVSTVNDAFVPDQRYLWHGPAAALGVVVWSHGKQGVDVDARGVQPPPFLRAFNNAGFDIVRFDRAPRVDVVLRAKGWLEDELPELRRMGYRRVVAAGHSRGGWTSLQMLDTPGLVDAVIALSPAAHGQGADSNLLAQDDDLRAIVADAAPGVRVAVAQFQADPFASDFASRAALLQRLRGKEAAVLLIDRPPGLRGHFGGLGASFSDRFASCLLRFVVDPLPPAACPGAQAEP